MKTLAIISHTEHYLKEDGSLVGLAPTVMEINHLLAIFDRIIHLAMLHSSPAPANTLAYCSDRIKFEALPALGGKNAASKIKMLWYAPKVLFKVQKVLKKADLFQFRAPTGIGVFVIPYLLLTSKRGWFKYAGNWQQKDIPITYNFQRWLLKNQSRKVTINGNWENQPVNCITFENPCLTQEELIEGANLEKHFDPQNISICFIGRLEKEKGFDLFLKAIQNLPPAFKNQISTVHIIGEDRNFTYGDLINNLGVKIVNHGLLKRSEVHKILKQTQLLILPSKTEGFPKVLAESWNYKCLTIASAIPGLDEYFHLQIARWLKSSNLSELQKAIEDILTLGENEFKTRTNSHLNWVENFTYNKYNNRIKELVLNE
ncbi:glycosyltransferase family 4 protein [Aegicerativicinus sediminis]|uniref:glycosyltransferase family 4 protein n=1 Tax=Aegicerativicinus sediminis TaxID=2893202 RepID=UPI001E316AC2|nr:glycosyltransferase [Aegicerativicinus sediminis]